MRIELSMPSTGLAYLPGLAAPRLLDSARLSTADAVELERLVAAADLPGLVSQVRERLAPDARVYQLTVQVGRRRHSIRVADPVEHPALAALIEFIRSRLDPGGTG
ncbi:MAG: protealysin inhibitor emfourin [Chloroflexota bacterium]